MTRPDDTAAPRLSRRDATGAGSARGVLFTVLGEFVLPHGQVAWTSAFIDVLGRLGVEEKATRQALMRTAADGWLAPQRVGRRTKWALTPAAERLLVDGTRRIYGFTGATADWDGRWVLVLARAPETERPARHLLRTRLTWAGLGNPAPGVWISPHAERLGEAEAALAEAGMLADAQIFVGSHAVGDVARLVELAWDVTAIESRYERFLADFDVDTAADPLARTVELVHAWRRFPWVDPALPRELLPTPWSGAQAAQRFALLHEKWSPAANADWHALN